MDSVNRPMHIYDKLAATETLCGEPNPVEMLSKGLVYTDKGYLTWYNNRSRIHYKQQNGRASVVKLGDDNYYIIDKGVALHLCKECYSLHVLVAA